MTKKLTRHGNSLALVIDKPILDLLKIDADTRLEITTNGDELVVKPQRDSKREKKFRESLEKTNEQFGRMLKKLAE